MTRQQLEAFIKANQWDIDYDLEEPRYVIDVDDLLAFLEEFLKDKEE